MPEALLNNVLASPADSKSVAPPVTHRSFDDIDGLRTSIFDNVLNATKTRYPIENARYRLELADLTYDEDKPFTLKDQKKAITAGRTLTRPLRGTWRLVDKTTNDSVDERKSVVAHVPYLTPRGTFIYRGNEYTVANQMRLKPGVYSRVKDNGLIEAHFNTKSGTGPSFRMYMEPDTGIFRLAVGQSTLKMYPIMRAMGVPDRDLEKAWGKELLQKNVEATDPRAVSRAYAKLVATRAEQPGIEAARQGIAKVAQYTPLEGDLVVGPSQIHGNGLYTSTGAEAGTRVTLAYTHTGNTADPDADFVRSGPVLWINHQPEGYANTALAIEPGGRFAYLVTTRPVQPWEELTSDYGKAFDVLRGWIAQSYDMEDSEVTRLIQSFSKTAATDKIPTVAVDLDGTLARHEPFDKDRIPDPRAYAVKHMKGLQRRGYRIIIWTVRGDTRQVKDWLHEHDIPYDYVNENPDQPDGASDKVIADAYVDDRGIDGTQAWREIEDQVAKALDKEAKIGFKETDMKWTKLWFTGHIRCEEGKDNEPWTYLEVHKGLADAALDALKSTGVECRRSPYKPHVTLIRGQEMQDFIKKHGRNWKGIAKDGMQVRFELKRITNLTPKSWDGVQRVWFIEVSSPELLKWRESLGLTPLPKNEDGHEHRFHITFAIHKPKPEVKRALYLLSGARAGMLERALEKQAETANEGTQLAEVFGKMELDPDVTSSTLGERFSTAGVPTLMRTSQKLLNIQRKLEDTDDRDSLAYQTLHGPEDFFAERVNKDAGQAGRRMLWKATLRGNLKHVPTGALTGQMYGVLLRSGMGMPLEETNPMDIYDQNLRVIRLGEGGIPSIEAVPDESRNVQPSHFGFLDPIRAPESSKIGIDSRVSHRVVKGSDGQFYTPMFNPRTGKESLVSAQQAAGSTIAFPGELAKKGKKVRAMVKSRAIEYVDRDKVDYELENPTQMFTASSNLVPMISGIKGGRLLMGAKYFSQALPLKQREAPLVQSADGDASFDELFGERVGAIRAKQRGVVTDVGEDRVTVRYADGNKHTHELYRNFPFNRKTFIHNEPTVKIGDQIKPGQTLATSNYTDPKGQMALGTNLRTAYMPYKGLNFEDAVVISESAAKRLSSEHMYQNTFESDEDSVIGRKQFISIYPTKFNKQQLGTIDTNGAVKPGTEVKQGDPLVLSMRRNKASAVHRGHKPMFSDQSVTWDHEAPGVVTDVDELDDGGWNVTVKSYNPAQEGDKLAGRYGDKGVIAKVVPDDQMVHDKDGKPYEILLNPLGIITRGNPSQVFETLLGKVARKRGEPVRMPHFSKENLFDYTRRELGREGLKDTDDLYDPETRSKVPDVLTGERFIFKLHHTAETKGKGRDVGAYTAEGLPAKGGELGAKRVSNMEQNALVSHGATAVLRDAQVVRGQRNDDFWRAFRLGYTPPSPKQPMVYDKFLSYMKASGINIKKDGNRQQVLAMTDRDVGKMSSGEIKSAKTAENDSLKEIGGGLFDRSLTGGHGGNKWTHIELNEPMPNPIMEEPVRRILGLTKKKFEAVLEGTEQLAGETGGAAIGQALTRVNLDSAIDNARSTIRDGAKSKRDNAVKVLGYLKTLKDANMHPKDLMLSKVPVLPPAMRPVTQFKSMQLSADPNFLYKDLIHANDDLAAVKEGLGARHTGKARLRTYNAFKAVTGLGDPVQAKTREKRVKGLLAHVFGSSPKYGMFQRRVIGSPVDVVGRATITPNPSLSMDQVGIPEDKAWTIYRPFITRRLIRRGMPAMEAAKAVANRTDGAARAMQEEMGARPVLINRAPTLHRYGFMAAWPVITKGKTLQVSPVTVGGFNADFDGDAMNYHVPVTDEAVADAVDRMLPSKNLKAVRDFKTHYVPKNEFLMGLYLASTANSKKPPRIFRSRADVLKAYQRGDIGLSDRVSIRS